MQLKKLLVVVDEKHNRQPALKRAAWLAEQTSATLEVLLVDYDSSFDSFLSFSKEKNTEKDSFLANKKKWLDNLVLPIQEQGVSVNTTVRWNKIYYKEVLAFADEIKPDIVFKSAYSENMLKRLFITNSSWQLIRNCEFPLWLVQHSDWDHDNICVALDPLHTSDKPAYLDNELIAISQELSKKLNMSANYLHSYAAMPRPQLFGGERSEAYEQYYKGFVKEHTDAFEGLLSHYPEIPKDHQFLLEGFAEEVIPEFINLHRVSLMIMGAVARGSLDNLLIGHTAERVLEAIECDLLVVHPKPQPEQDNSN